MLSWILRHRTRLQVIYGLSETPVLAGERFAGGPRSALLEGEAAGRVPARLGVPRRRASGQIEVRPMPRRVG